MGKTLTIHDDDLRAAMAVRIEQAPGQNPLITDIRFTADDGAGLSSAALGLMQDLGLALPATAPVAPARRRKSPARKPAVAARKTPAAKTAPAPAPPAPAQRAGDDGPEPLPAGARPALTAAISATPATAAAAPRQKRRTGPPPTTDELRAAFVRHGGEIAPMAGHFGASVSSVAGWLRKAREAGASITLPADAR